MGHIQWEQVTRYLGGDFDRKILWNVSAFTESSHVSAGYIVQHIFRKTEDTKGTFVGADYNHDYWEAWKVNNNRIILEEDTGYHDRWTTAFSLFTVPAMEYCIRQNAEKRRDSSGHTEMEGYVYWAPLGSDLFHIVQKTFKVGKVIWAGQLLSTEKITEYQKFKYVFHHMIRHPWNIDETADIEQLVTPIEE